MSVPEFILLDDVLVPTSEIAKVDISKLVTETVLVLLKNGTIHTVTGFAALELVWCFKPSALEGNNRVKWKKNMWVIHNIFAHPLMQMLSWFGAIKWAIWIHDATVPKPKGYKNIRR